MSEPAPPPDPTRSSTPDGTPTSDVIDGDASTSLPVGLREMVDIAVADLMGRRGLSEPGDVEVVKVEEVTWRDRGLGCPSKDMQYAQVLTDGTRIVLATGGYSYHYHAGHGREPFYCPNPEPPVGE